MKVIENIKPETFFCSEPNLRVYDERKKVFYVHPNEEEKITFNLPKGKFYTPNTIWKQEIFIPYANSFISLPKGESKGIRIKIGDNPNKATIFRNRKFILIDRKFANHEFAPVPVFCIAHELSHFLFFPKTQEQREDKDYMIEIEKQCDENAVNYMYWKGYNPTQIKLAKNIILSNKERGICVDNLTTNHFNNFRR